MTQKATRYLDGLLRGVPGFTDVYFGGPPQGGPTNPCIVYMVIGDARYGTLGNPNRVVSVDYEITVRSNDASTVEGLGQRVWDALAGNRRIREIGEFAVSKFIAQDGSEETATEFFATKSFRVRVK